MESRSQYQSTHKSTHYLVRKKQNNIFTMQREEDDRKKIIKKQKLGMHLIELIISNNSSLLNEMSVILRKYIHAGWLIDKDNFKRLQAEFLIKPLFHLFQNPLKEKLGQDINLPDVDLAIDKIFHKFLGQDFVNEYFITLINKSSKKILENTKDDDEPRKSHILGVLNQIYNDSMEGYALIKLGEYTAYATMKKRIPILNKMTRLELTEKNFDIICTSGFIYANKTEIMDVSKNAQILFLFSSFMYSLTKKINDPIINSYSFYLDIVIVGAVILISINTFLKTKSDYNMCNMEKSIHQELSNKFISAEILDELLDEIKVNEKIEAEKLNYQSKKISQPIVVYQENNTRERDDSYLNRVSNERDIIRIKREKVKEEINVISQEILNPILSNVSITWVVGGQKYTYHSNDAISNINQLYSDDNYLMNFAKNNYVYFDEDIVWKIAGDKVKYQHLKNAFDKGEVVKSVNDTGFVYRPDENQNWTLKLKVVHKKGMGHLNLMFKQVAEAKSVSKDDVTLSRLFMPAM